MLLVGYGYVHLLSNRLTVNKQIILHVSLLLAALLFLPIIPSVDLKPSPGADPAGAILMVLTATVAAPYLLLAATSPLLQRWFALAGGGSATWRLYAVSNSGSLLALLSYPFLIEPYVTLNSQLTS